MSGPPTPLEKLLDAVVEADGTLTLTSEAADGRVYEYRGCTVQGYGVSDVTRLPERDFVIPLGSPTVTVERVKVDWERLAASLGVPRDFFPRDDVED